MANLKRYNGNFVDYVDNFDFNSAKRQSFEGVSGLDIDVSSDVAILPGSSSVVVEIDSERPENFSVSVNRGELCIVEKGAKNGAVFSQTFNGGRATTVVSSGQNISIVNGVVYVNGVRRDGSQPIESVRPSKVRVYAPSGLDLTANINGQAVLASKVPFNEAKVEVHGQSTIGLAAVDIELSIHGQGDSFVVSRGGELDVDVHGQGSVTAKGEFSEVSAEVHGMGKINTSGNCNGRYSAQVSGMGSIQHSGSVAGRVRKNVSGMGSITGL